MRSRVLPKALNGRSKMLAVAKNIMARSAPCLVGQLSIPEPGWHDLFALTKRGAASIEGDLRPLLQNLQYFKDLLALPRRLPVGA